jgi:hypothetical protein
MTDNYSYIQDLICKVSPNPPFFASKENYKGGFDRYQCHVITFLIAGAVVLPTSLVYGMTFLFLEPKLLCKNEFSGPWYECDRETACTVPFYQIDYTNEDTIVNLITKMDILCSSGYHSLLASIGAVTLFGFLIGSLVLLPYADYYGRRKMNIIFLCAMCVSMWLFDMAMSLFSTYWLVCLACFIGGAVSIPLIGVMICYATELSTLEFVPICTCLSFCAEAFTSILIGLYFQQFKDATIFYLVISVLLTVFLIVYYMFARETPHF